MKDKIFKRVDLALDNARLNYKDKKIVVVNITNQTIAYLEAIVRSGFENIDIFIENHEVDKFKNLFINLDSNNLKEKISDRLTHINRDLSLSFIDKFNSGDLNIFFGKTSIEIDAPHIAFINGNFYSNIDSRFNTTKFKKDYSLFLKDKRLDILENTLVGYLIAKQTIDYFLEGENNENTIDK